MFEFYDVEQNTDAWLQLRAGKLTSSNLGKVMANYGKAFGDPAKKLAVQIAIEQITGKPQESGYSNDHMDRGHEQEPIARIAASQMAASLALTLLDVRLTVWLMTTASLKLNQ